MVLPMLRLSVSFICLVLSVTVSLADTGADHLRALRKAAGENDPEAQYSLAMEILSYCRLTKEQQNEAIGWLRAAADRSDGRQPTAQAQLKLGKFYHAGIYTGKDVDEALRWYRRAADNLVVEAMLQLAEAYMVWSGTQRPDPAESIRWLQRAANLGSAEAANKLGMIYVNGQDAYGRVVPQDYAEARKWFLRAAPAMLAKSCAPYGQVPPVRGNCRPAEYLGTLFAKGLGTPQDFDSARSWFEAASRNYSPYSDYSLGGMHERGQGVPADISKALAYYRAAADNALPAAQYRLGLAYLSGDGVEADSAEALKWLALALGQKAGSFVPAGSYGRNLAQSADKDRGPFDFGGGLSTVAYDDAVAKVIELSKSLDPRELVRADASRQAFGMGFLQRRRILHPPPARCRPQP